ncbi:MAG: branched-chain amino acid ABC transporter permease [Alphaproteobacteria bacterium]|nr:branched-chain amino acid ABC transporter permease [Alphaproteobacteria bacterium]
MNRRTLLFTVLLVIAAAVPALGSTYDTRFATQIAIYGMAALSVDLLLGYGGLITFGQAALFGIGAYAAGMLTAAGITDALIVWPASALITMVFALVIGALALRTSGFQFIMVTLAFAQMVYYGGQSLRAYGGDNGFTVTRNTVAGTAVLGNQVVFYYVVLALLVAVIALAGRVVNSQFGLVLRGGRDNERRLAAIGFPPYHYRLVAFTIAGGIAGLAGALMANHASFVSPALMSWQMSGELLAMVILGSAGTLVGPVFGAAIYLVFAQMLSDYTQHWMLFFGPLLVLRVLLVKDGLWGSLVRLMKAGEAPAAPPLDWGPEAAE